MTRLDHLDNSIIQLLQEDGRRSNREVARLIGVTEGTIRLRLKKLKDLHEFEIMTLKNPYAFGYECFAHLLFAVVPCKVRSFVDRLSLHEDIIYSGLTLSKYNVYSVSVSKTREVLEDFLNGKVAHYDGFLGCRVFESTESHRFDYHWMTS